MQAASFAYKKHSWLNGTADRSYIRVVVRLPGDAPSRKEDAHAQILKRQRGMLVNQVPSGSAGLSPALCTNTKGSVAQWWSRALPVCRHGFDSRRPHQSPFAWEANLVKAPR